MSDLAGLIERLENEEGPDRNLADEVLLACGWRAEETALEEIGKDARTGEIIFRRTIMYWSDPEGGECSEDDRPHPLHSLDDALFLVPEGCEVILRTYTEEGFNHRAHVQGMWETITPPNHRAKSLAHAVCAAIIALRMRVAEARGEVSAPDIQRGGGHAE